MGPSSGHSRVSLSLYRHAVHFLNQTLSFWFSKDVFSQIWLKVSFIVVIKTCLVLFCAMFSQKIPLTNFCIMEKIARVSLHFRCNLASLWWKKPLKTAIWAWFSDVAKRASNHSKQSEQAIVAENNYSRTEQNRSSMKCYLKTCVKQMKAKVKRILRLSMSISLEKK